VIVLAKCIARCFPGRRRGRACRLRLLRTSASRLVARASELEGVGGERITLAALDRLVVLNNPDLRAARAKVGIGAAGDAGRHPPESPGCGHLPVRHCRARRYPECESILLLGTKGEAAQNAAFEISATLLWQEWQTLSKARLLFVDIVSGERAKKLIVQSRNFLQERFDLTSTAISQGNATLATLSPDLVAVGDIQKTYDDLERLQLSRRYQLNALLGLAPRAKLTLVAPAEVARIDPAAILSQVSTLADRRPDLIALQYGYRSEDAKVREAILSQFPNLLVGVVSVGTGNMAKTLTLGPQLTVDLPMFDRNQGGIAVEQATREQLYREFNARISAAAGEIGALLSEQALLSPQLADLEPRLKEARTILVGLALMPASAAEEGSVLVTIMMPSKGSLPDVVTAYGTAGPAVDSSMTISLQSQGRVLHFAVTPGEAVKAGQPLLEFSVSESALGSYRQVEIALQTAKVERSRIAQLLKQQFATKDQLTQADQAIADAQTTLDTLKKSGSDQPDLTIKAPFDGVVSTIPVAQGDTIAPGAPMMTLMRAGGLVVRVGIEPAQWFRMKRGDPVMLQPMTSGGAPASGMLIRIDGLLNPKTHLIDADVRRNLQGADHHRPLRWLRGAARRGAERCQGRLRLPNR
jgi:biotin carboxyl carrier protein